MFWSCNNRNIYSLIDNGRTFFFAQILILCLKGYLIIEYRLKLSEIFGNWIICVLCKNLKKRWLLLTCCRNHASETIWKIQDLFSPAARSLIFNGSFNFPSWIDFIEPDVEARHIKVALHFVDMDFSLCY